MTFTWQILPDLIFSEIIMMTVGMDKLENIPKCRQVCQSWDVKVSQMTKYEKDTIRTKAESLGAWIRALGNWTYADDDIPPLTAGPEIDESEIVSAAGLAHHGLLGSVEELVLCDVDLASVPTEHLAALASCVTERVWIQNVSNCDIVSLLDHAKSKTLTFNRQSLGSEESLALVRAMEFSVERVYLQEDIRNLDMTALTQYDGQGACEMVCVWCDWFVRWHDRAEKLGVWAQEITWNMDRDADDDIIITRREEDQDKTDNDNENNDDSD